jgi:hypothetical protein
MCFYILFKLLFLNVYFYSLKLYSSIIKAINSFINWFYSIWTDVFFRIICYFFYCWKIFFCCIKMIYSYLVHRYIHYWTMTWLGIVTWLDWIVLRRDYLRSIDSILACSHYKSTDSSTLLFFYFLTWLEYRRQ